MQRINGDLAGSPTVGATWRKSRHSNPCGSCVEIAALTYGRLAIRNSRHPRGVVLACSRTEMAAFIHGVKLDEFDRAHDGDMTCD